MFFLLVATAFAGRSRTAVVLSDDLAPYTSPVDAFVEELGEDAAVYNILGREAEAERVVGQLMRDRPDVVFCLGAKAAWIVRQGMPSTPLIYAAVMNPKRYGIEGDHVTGITTRVTPVTYISQMIGFFPDVRRIGLLRGPSTSDAAMADLVAAGRDVDVDIVVERVDSPKRVRAEFEGMADRIDALWLKPDRDVLTRETFRALVEETRRRRMPLLVDTDNMVRAGGLFAVVPDPSGVGRQAAKVAKRILDGDAPSGISAEDPVDVVVALNVRRVQTTGVPFDELLLDFVDIKIE